MKKELQCAGMALVAFLCIPGQVAAQTYSQAEWEVPTVAVKNARECPGLGNGLDSS